MKEELKKGWENIDRVRYYLGSLFIPEIIPIKLISRYHNDFLTSHFGINKTRKLISKKYYKFNLQKDIKAYMKDCDVCLASKTIGHKPFSDLQALSVPSH